MRQTLRNVGPFVLHALFIATAITGALRVPAEYVWWPIGAVTWALCDAIDMLRLGVAQKRVAALELEVQRQAVLLLQAAALMQAASRRIEVLEKGE